MKLFNLSFSTIIIRFYLMMAIVIGAMFAGVPLLALLAFPVFFITLVGVQFKSLPWSASRKTAPETNEIRESSVKRSHQPVH